MPKIFFSCCIVFFLANNTCIAQAEKVKNSYLIILSTKSYTEAKKAAVQAAETLDIDLNLRRLEPNKKTGLSIKKEVASDGTAFPYYAIRDKFANGIYASVEWSSGYKGFAKGYYLVVVDSGRPYDVLCYYNAQVKEHYKNAYIKNAIVYAGGAI